MEETKTCFRYQWAPIISHAANRFSYPRRIAREKFVVLGRTQKTNDAKLDDKVIDNFLCLLFCEQAQSQITFEVDIKEGRDPAERHGGAVLFLDGREIAEVQPLHGVARIPGWR